MSTTLTSPHNLRDTKLRDRFAEMRDRDRMSAIANEEVEEPDANRHVCRTCAHFTGLDGCDRYTPNRLHLRLDDLDAVMSGVGICSGGKDEDDRVPSPVPAEDGTCGEWEGLVTCATSASSAA